MLIRSLPATVENDQLFLVVRLSALNSYYIIKSYLFYYENILPYISD